MAKVFVSYSRKDIDFAKQLTYELQKSDLDFWIDWEGIPPTVDWWKEIEKGIEEADIFLFLISPDSAKSKICGKEIDTAVKNGKRIIPIVVREIEWEDTPPQLGHLNYIFFSRNDDFDTAVKKLMTAIQTDYEWAAIHRRLQVKALEWERNHKENSFLLRGKDLQDAELQLAKNTSKEPHPTDLQREYVFESRKATDKQRRFTTGISVAGVIVLAVLAIFGFYQANKATRQATISRAGELAAQSELLLTRDFQTSLLLANEAFRVLDRTQTRGALLDSANASPNLIQFFPDASRNVYKVKYSPDGKIIASSHQDGTFILWDAKTRQIISKTSTGVSSLVFDIIFNPDGKSLATTQEGIITLWDISDPTHPKLIGQPIAGTYPMAFSPDGKTLAAVGFNDARYAIIINLWNAETHQRIGNSLVGHENGIGAIAFSPDGKKLVSGDFNGIIIARDIATGESIFSLKGNISNSLAFSPDGKVLASGGEDATVVLLDAETGQSIGKPLDGHTNVVTSVAFNFDGTILASGSTDKTIILWDPKTGKRLLEPLTGHAGFVNSIGFGPNITTFVSSGAGGIILWDATKYSPIAQTVSEGRYYVCGNVVGCPDNVAIDPNRQLLAWGDSDNNITLWDVKTLQPIRKVITEAASEIFSLAFSPDGKMLAFGTKDGNDILLWDVESGQRVGKPLTGHTGFLNNVVFRPDGKVLASAGVDDGTIILWDVETQQPIGAPIQTNYPVLSIAFSPDGKMLASSSFFKTTLLWNMSAPSQPQLIGEPLPISNTINSLAFSPDGKMLALGADNGSIILWDIAKNQPMGSPLSGHTGQVMDVAFSLDGKTLASSSHDFTIILWDLTDPTQPQPIGQPIKPPLTYRTSSVSLAFTTVADGNVLVADNDSFLTAWNLNPQLLMDKNCERAGRNFTRAEWVKYFPNEEYRKTCEQWPLEPEITNAPTVTP